MQIDIVTLFPDIFFGPFSESIIGRAISKGIVKINCVDLRNYTDDKHRTVDDTPYGGGPGMLMKAEPLFKAVEDCKSDDSLVILTTPQGKPYNQKMAEELSHKKHLVFVCGHYEGVDQRVIDELIDHEVSVGDYILTGGELAAMVLVDAVMRFVPGVLGNEDSPHDESFSNGLLEYPHYTRPADFKGLCVPEVLLSGHHKNIEEWRQKKAIEITKKLRPDMIARKKKE